MADRIFIEPLDGKFKGQLLVFDVVKAMDHLRGSTVYSHPVEHLNTTISDHRYRTPASIKMSGYVSDSWISELVEQPDGSFIDYARVEEKLLLQSLNPTTDREARLFRDVQLLLSGEEPDLVFGDGPNDDFTDEDAIKEAKSIEKKKQDTDKRKEEKGLDFSDDISNSQEYATQINTIQQTIEVLDNIDQESILCDVHSKYQVYENMALVSFSNPLAAGAEAQAYHFNLTWQEQTIAEVLVNTSIVIIEKSELAELNKNSGKDGTNEFDGSDPINKELAALWEEAKAQFFLDNVSAETDATTIKETKAKVVKLSISKLTPLEKRAATQAFLVQAGVLALDKRNQTQGRSLFGQITNIIGT